MIFKSSLVSTSSSLGSLDSIDAKTPRSSVVNFTLNDHVSFNITYSGRTRWLYYSLATVHLPMNTMTDTFIAGGEYHKWKTDPAPPVRMISTRAGPGPFISNPFTNNAVFTLHSTKFDDPTGATISEGISTYTSFAYSRSGLMSSSTVARISNTDVSVSIP